MIVEPLGCGDDGAVEDFLHRQKGGLLYYSNRYRCLVTDLLGCNDESLVARDGGRVVGFLPLMRTSGRFGDVINSLPFYGSNGGILADTALVAEGLVEAYNEIVAQRSVGAATLVSNPLQACDYSNVLHGMNDHRIGQFTPIASAANDPNQLLASFESSTRRNIRKALNSDVRLEVNNCNFDFLERLHRDNMERIGGKAKPPRFFSLVDRHFRRGEDYSLYVAKKDGEPVAALLLFYYNRVVEYYIPALKDEFRTFQPLALIVYQAMVDAALRGFRLWNWGGTWPDQTGVHSFKKKWGTIEQPYSYYIQLNSDAIRQARKLELVADYDNFYVIPYSKLASNAVV